ncbi:hypothetical protein AAEX28_13040 [Lentisphaerota bacterium WC36G]|nr:hypothetical protein LJT99_15865 [Lentisphaerae bacterium WC36]
MIKMSKISIEEHNKKLYKNYLKVFLWNWLLLLLLKLSLALGVFWILHYIYYRLSGEEQFSYFITVVIVNILAGGYRVYVNTPIITFAEFNNNQSFVDATNDDFDKVDDTSFSFGQHFRHSPMENHLSNKIMEKIFIYLIPGGLIVDTVYIIIKMIIALLTYSKYTDIMIILIERQREGIPGEEIYNKLLASKATLNQIELLQRLDEMTKFEWILHGADGYKLTTAMMRKVDPSYDDTNHHFFNSITSSQSDLLVHEEVKYSQQKERQEREKLRENEQQRLTEKFFSITEKID